MSLGIVFKGPEGIVLAADSRVTLTGQMPGSPPGQTIMLPATFDNATKLLFVKEQKYVGAVTYGLGAIGQAQVRTAHSFMPEFENSVKGLGRLSVPAFAERLSAFFVGHWQANMPANFQGPDMVFLVGGYDDDDAAYGRVFSFQVPHQATPQELQAAGGFGISWGGQREFADRLLQGFEETLPQVVADYLHLAADKVAGLRDHLRSKFNPAIPYQFLPLQDCVDMSIFLIRTTMTIQDWSVRLRGVGGEIDVATITRTEGFCPIQQKHITGDRGSIYG